MKILLLLAQRLGVDVGTDLAAATSRTDVEGHCQAFIPTDPLPLTSANTMNAVEEFDGVDVDIDDFDLDAIMRSFDPNPPQPIFTNDSTDVQGHLEETCTGRYEEGRTDSAYTYTTSNTSEGRQAEGTLATDFDTLFGFNADFDLQAIGFA